MGTRQHPLFGAISIPKKLSKCFLICVYCLHSRVVEYQSVVPPCGAAVHMCTALRVDVDGLMGMAEIPSNSFIHSFTLVKHGHGRRVGGHAGAKCLSTAARGVGQLSQSKHA